MGIQEICLQSHLLAMSNQWRLASYLYSYSITPGIHWRNGGGDCKSEGWNLKMEGGKLQNEEMKDEERTFFFSLLKTTKIYFGSTKMEIFYREKAFYAGKKNQEKWLCTLRKIFLLRPCWEIGVVGAKWGSFLLGRGDNFYYRTASKNW